MNNELIDYKNLIKDYNLENVHVVESSALSLYMGAKILASQGQVDEALMIIRELCAIPTSKYPQMEALKARAEGFLDAFLILKRSAATSPISLQQTTEQPTIGQELPPHGTSAASVPQPAGSRRRPPVDDI